MAGGFLTAVDARTGQAVAAFGQDGRVDLRAGLAATGRSIDGLSPLQPTNPGRVFDDLVIVSLPAQAAGYDSNPGDVHAYDVRTGALRWVFHSLPAAGEVGADTWPQGARANHGGVHNWSELTIDEARGIAFVPFGTGRFDFYGGDRPGQNLFANSLVALDARTGRRLWHYQIVHHDVWDYDLPVAPKLLTIRQNGRPRDVVAQATKHGFLFVFDRVTGEPIWPIEERPVPQSDVPGERTWPTQPVPTKPAPFARQSFTERDINPYLPDEERRAIRGALAKLPQRRAVHASEHPRLDRDAGAQRRHQLGRRGRRSRSRRALRAVDGAADDAAVAPAGRERARLGARRSGHDRLGRRSGAAHAPGRRGAAKGPVRFTSPYDFMFTSTYLSPIGPPWSEIVAYDLNTGEIKWRVPHGSVAAPAATGDPVRQRRALAARRPAGHGRRAAVCRLRIRQDAARLRPAHRTGGLDAIAACGVRRRAGVVRGRRTPVHRAAGGGSARLECRALPDAAAAARQRLHRVRVTQVGRITYVAAGFRPALRERLLQWLRVFRPASPRPRIAAWEPGRRASDSCHDVGC